MERSSFSLVWFLFSFEGRIGRLGYWMYGLGTVAAFFAVLFPFGYLLELATVKDAPPDQLPMDPVDAILFGILICVLAIFYFWSTYAVAAKRWHDRNKSGWWSLIGLVPYIGSIWMLVECGFLRGTDGPNRFGGHPEGMRPEQLATVFE